MLPDIFNAFTRLQILDLSGNNLTGHVPTKYPPLLHSLILSGNNFAGVLPSEWPASLRVLFVRNNPELAGEISKALILQCENIGYANCKPHYGLKGEKNSDFMNGPFFVGASMASENIAHLLRQRAERDISEQMIQSPPKKGDKAYTMFETHGPKWCAWQDVWLDGLQGLRNRDVFVLSGHDEFLEKFKKNHVIAPDASVDERISFDPTYRLPPGQRARNILDWERRQLMIASIKNNLTIKHLNVSADIPQPPWYYDMTPEEAESTEWLKWSRKENNWISEATTPSK